jgi:hypothetical protein
MPDRKGRISLNHPTNIFFFHCRTFNISLSEAAVVPSVTVKSPKTKGYALVNFYDDIKPPTYQIFVTDGDEITQVTHLSIYCPHSLDAGSQWLRSWICPRFASGMTGILWQASLRVALSSKSLLSVHPVCPSTRAKGSTV